LLSLTASAQHDAAGAIAGLTVVARDVTTLHDTAQALRVSEERLRLVLAATSDAIWDWDLRSGRAFWSDRLREMVEPAEEVPSALEALVEAFVHPDDRWFFGNVNVRGLEPGKRYRLELRLRHRSGKYRLCALVGEVMPGPDGAPGRFVGTVTDITERRAAERERVAIARELHDTVVQDLVAAGLYSDEALSLLDELIAGRPATREALEQIAAAMRHLHGQLRSGQDDMREMLAQLRANGTVPGTTEAGSPATLREALTGLVAQFAGRNSAPRIELDPQADGDGIRLAQETVAAATRIVREALTNVIKHAGAQRASVSVRRDGRTVAILVSDDGAGWTLDAASEDGGLGLFGMRERAQGAGGQLLVRTGRGEGTTVQAVFPLSDAASEDPSPA
jgi:PAS domain S-box-containing protein